MNGRYKRNYSHTTAVDLAEHEDLELIVQREYTRTGNTTEDVGSSTLEEGLCSLLGDDLSPGVEHGLVVDRASRCHHHATTEGELDKPALYNEMYTEWYREDTKQDQHQ